MSANVDFCTARAESLISPYDVAADSACMPFYLFVVGKNGKWKKIRTQAKL